VLRQLLLLELSSELVDEQEVLELCDRLDGLEQLELSELKLELEELETDWLLEEELDEEDSSVSCRPNNQMLYVMSAPLAVNVI
jgi:hypothetical protein